MAKGDVINGLSSINAAAYLTIQPGAGVEWVIHNIYHANDIQLETYDGDNSCIFDTDAGAGIYAKYSLHLTNSIYLRVKNTAVAAQNISYDGIISK